jgi:hypothetical protein
MKQFNAKQILVAYEELRNVVMICEDMNSQYGGSPDEKFIGRARQAIEWAREVCSEVGFHRALTTIERAGEELRNTSVTDEYLGLRGECNRVADALFDDVNEHAFISVHPNRVACIDNPHLLGEMVVRAFPLFRTEIIEAGNCLASECNTAAVFHLMRVVEHGLRRLCASLGLKKAKMRYQSGKGRHKYIPISYADWETMLNQLHPLVEKKIEKIKRGPKKQEEQEFYYPILQDIKAIRDAWRNHIMHGRALYGSEDAAAVHAHVRRIMRKLSERELRNEEAKSRVRAIRRGNGKAAEGIAH